MHLIQALYLWSFVSLLVVGGAFAFRRFFPEESPWFGFIVPPVAFVALLDFIEHFVALPHLLWLLPVLLGVLAWLGGSPYYPRREVMLPAAIFLGSFAFTFAIRCLTPDILPSSDGLSDLNKINNYCQGDILPPTDCWMPPFHYVWYYSLQHYAASIIKRLFDVRVGVAYNTAHALLSALTCVAGAGAAHRLSGGRVWVTVAIPFLIEAAATGSSAFIQIFTTNPSPWLANNLSGGLVTPPDDGFFWKWLGQTPYRERLELQVPGFWTWRDEYHANMAGHFLALCGVLVSVELALMRRSVWPWALAVVLPLLGVIASTWSYPLLLLLCGGILVIALMLGRRPASIRNAAALLFGSLILLWPAFYDVTASPQLPEMMWTQPEWRTPWREFLVQWWPIILLWACGCIHCRTISPAVRWILIVIPLMLIGIELITIEGRYNTVEKMWGYTFGVGLIALFPIVASRVSIGCRIVTIILLLSATISMFGWLRNTFRWAPWVATGANLEGSHYLTVDEQKRRMLEVMMQMKRQTFLSGKCIWCYNEAPALAVFSGNRSYIAWSYFESVADYKSEAEYREKLNNEFYSGAMADPLHFLQANKVSGVLIWPDDNIPDAQLATLTKQLASDYEYIDCKNGFAHNAGVFLRRPLPENPH